MAKKTIELLEENEYNQEQKGKSTNTAFILMFPSLILAGIGALYAPLFGSLLSIALVIYQFLLLKKFIEDYYKNR